MKTKNKKTTQIRVRVTPEMHDRIFSLAEKLGISPSELTRQALVLYLNMLEKNQKEGEAQ